MIRIAVMEDAEASVAVLRASITELCVLDHQNDQEILELWLRNKTPAQFRTWVGSSDHRLLVEHQDETVSAVGGASDRGEITLNYVAPWARFRGQSKMMLSALEQHLKDQGHERVQLTSTNTAHGFYQSLGYVDAGEPPWWGKLPGYPMVKCLF